VRKVSLPPPPPSPPPPPGQPHPAWVLAYRTMTASASSAVPRCSCSLLLSSPRREREREREGGKAGERGRVRAAFSLPGPAGAPGNEERVFNMICVLWLREDNQLPDTCFSGGFSLEIRRECGSGGGRVGRVGREGGKNSHVV